MEPSRDDFVIAIRSAFLKKGTKQRFSLLALLFFSILLIILTKLNFAAINYLKIGVNEIVFRTSFIASIPEKYIYQPIIIYTNKNTNKKRRKLMNWMGHLGNTKFIKPRVCKDS